MELKPLTSRVIGELLFKKENNMKYILTSDPDFESVQALEVISPLSLCRSGATDFESKAAKPQPKLRTKIDGFVKSPKAGHCEDPTPTL